MEVRAGFTSSVGYITARAASKGLTTLEPFPGGISHKEALMSFPRGVPHQDIAEGYSTLGSFSRSIPLRGHFSEVHYSRDICCYSTIV